MEPQAPPKKRKRVAIACPECRSRKTKCDHIVSRQVDDDMLKGIPKSSQAYIRSLEQRLRKFEEQETRAHGKPDQPASLAQHSRRSQAYSSPPPHVQQRQSILISANPEIFMGGYSGISFTQLILNAMNGADSNKLEAQSLSSPRDPPCFSTPSDLFALPPNCRDLIDLFFDFHYELSPIFHAPTLLAKIDRLIAGDTAYRSEHRYILAIMNMLLAIAASHQRHRTESSASSTRGYYDVAMALVGPTLLFDWKIEKVQILLLGARYLQSSSSPSECWNVLGLAIRIAYGLELHRAPGEEFDCIMRETRKRVWYACYGLDQLLSMIYGRPAATSSSTSDTPLPEDLDDDCIQKSRLLFPSLEAPSTMSFSIQVSKLYRLLESAASYADPPLETLVQLDEAFESWYAGVPPNLKVRGNMTVQDDKCLILALRANMVRILIHRQSLASTLSLLSKSEQAWKHPETLKSSMLQNSRRICVQTAEETIDLVGLRYDQTKHALGPSWFNLYYLFNAILIVVSHVVDPEYRNDKRALSQLDRAMQMIRQMSTNHQCAQRAYTFLQQLLSFMDRSLLVEGRRGVSSSRPQTGTVSSPLLEGSTNDDGGYDDLVHPDLFAFWDITQDLTTNLGTQLESYSSLGCGMWSWDVNAQHDIAQ
ncbi:hypothetical protein AYO21_10893 [Fonsecaea monophora]|uniref:Xylanolytic transcriptional activator regulatory domain-containing protein n=1 Tax=Fonsecaea monophora TaxID=254056 RepID=A0A177EV68_9EURO|nr:hypothetical protein AYO21_10893 [Fonsecaea monophora]OAG34942.1 hypothetical protein AYO21_10893 [Fonsecaea monophora]